MEYNIFLYSTKSKWTILGKVDATHNVINLTPNHLPKSIHIINMTVFDQIKNVQGTTCDPSNYFSSGMSGTVYDKIEFLFLGTMRYRRCTIYLVLQFSYMTYQLRVLAFGTDQILHHAICFGTSLDSVNQSDMEKSIREYIETRSDILMNQIVLEKLKSGQYTMFIDE